MERLKSTLHALQIFRGKIAPEKQEACRHSIGGGQAGRLKCSGCCRKFDLKERG
jgi:hypothetical protein